MHILKKFSALNFPFEIAYIRCNGTYSQLPNKQDVGIRGMDGTIQTNSKRDGRNKSHGGPFVPPIPFI